jgi:hypothetical protein
MANEEGTERYSAQRRQRACLGLLVGAGWTRHLDRNRISEWIAGNRRGHRRSVARPEPGAELRGRERANLDETDSAVLVVFSLERLRRSLGNLLALVGGLHKRGV